MSKQKLSRIKTTINILIAVFLIVTLTVASASACSSKSVKNSNSVENSNSVDNNIPVNSNPVNYENPSNMNPVNYGNPSNMNPVNGNLDNGFNSNSWIWTFGSSAIRPIGFYKKIIETRDFFIIFWILDWLQPLAGKLIAHFVNPRRY